METKEYSVEIGGKELKAQFTDLANQAHGSVIIKYGDTVVLATAVMSEKERDGVDYFPLSVEFEEKFYAAGKILGSRFMRREGRPSDEAILSGRVVDRTIRPLFDSKIRNDVQVVITVLSIGEDDPDVLAVLGASLSLATSDIPWNGPVSAVRMGKTKDQELVVNPIYSERGGDDFLFDMIICGSNNLVNMIEVGARENKESEILLGIEKALAEIKKLEDFQNKIISEVGKKKRVVSVPEIPSEFEEIYKNKIEKNLSEFVMANAGKSGIKKLKKIWDSAVEENLSETNPGVSDRFFDEKINNFLHKEAVLNNKRPDGRNMDEVRPLFAKAGGLSNIVHGSGIFYRGGTHILSVLTLGSPGDSLLIDGIEVQGDKRFIHHYNFPPFSSGETGRVGGFNRRMIGHGALAEKALLPVIPTKESFPYTIRVVSESLASNGSTSMASVCGSTLALMDAGVPIKTPVTGIASGLMMIKNGSGKILDYKILTDIQGPEDEHGDMDFKVAGTKEGITAVQMDVKVDGIPTNILEEAFEKARNARLKIIDCLEKEISSPRPEISKNAPHIITIKIRPDQIGSVIGTGGKIINEIKEKTGADIDIEDDGSVFITGKGGGAEEAQKIIEEITYEYKAGDKFEGEVIKVVDFGAFVKIGNNTEGLVHVSEIAPWRIEDVSKVLKAGDKIPVVVKGVDDRGKIKLSIKDTDPNFIKKP